MLVSEQPVGATGENHVTDSAAERAPTDISNSEFFLCYLHMKYFYLFSSKHT